jgi:sporulation protein YlmC with PRC-barrel domain
MTEPKVLYLGRHLLDHQIVGISGDQVGKVDDLELDASKDRSAPFVVALLTGQIAYGAQFKGAFGRWVTTSAQRLRGVAGGEPCRIDASLIRSVTHTVVLNVPAADLPTPDLEDWLATHFIGRIPGAGP